MIFLEKPKGFIPDFHAVGCFLEADGDILMLLRSEASRLEPRKWGVPAGKVEPGETVRRALMREIDEETGLIIVEPTRFRFYRFVYIIYPFCRFYYHIFSLKFERKPEISLSKEHIDHVWVPPQEALKMSDLMLDEDYCIRLVYQL